MHVCRMEGQRSVSANQQTLNFSSQHQPLQRSNNGLQATNAYPSEMSNHSAPLLGSSMSLLGNSENSATSATSEISATAATSNIPSTTETPATPAVVVY